VAIIASSHRTPVVRDGPTEVLPHQAVVLYHSYAHERLAAAVGGQQAGSMVLYGLGKVYARLAERKDNHIPSMRSAITMHSAALTACPMNPMAANELGVLLCRNGHAAHAATLFRRTIDLAPSATAYHNLAVAEQKMGMQAQAEANQREADRLAAWERATGALSRRAGIQWVSPSELASVAPPPLPPVPLAAGFMAPPSRPSAAVIGTSSPPSAWQKAIEVARSVTGTNGDTVRR
jgi:hypothetical protein